MQQATSNLSTRAASDQAAVAGCCHMLLAGQQEAFWQAGSVFQQAPLMSAAPRRPLKCAGKVASGQQAIKPCAGTPEPGLEHPTTPTCSSSLVPLLDISHGR